MRGFIMTILLTISFGAFASDYQNYSQRLSGDHTFITIPNSDKFEFIKAPTAPRVTLKPSEIKTCELRARMGASALVRAHDGVSRIQQLEAYDALISEKDFELSAYEKQKLREILIMSNTVYERHPDMPTEEFGDILYDVCFSELESNTKTEI